MAKVINVAGLRCPSEGLEEFDEWYSEKHIPDMMTVFPGLKKATRYKLIGNTTLEKFKITGVKQAEYPTFMTIYEFDSREDFEDFNTNPVLDASREDWVNISKETGAEMVFRAQYESTKTFER